MPDEQISRPDDFISVTAILPDGAEEQMVGYEGCARFVGFYWNESAEAVLWADGSGSGPKHGQSKTFMRFIQPLAFLYAVNLGTHGAPATHMFVWDRERSQAYLAPHKSAQRFLKEQKDVLWVAGPVMPSTSSSAQIPGY